MELTVDVALAWEVSRTWLKCLRKTNTMGKTCVLCKRGFVKMRKHTC